jgi:hypothetical protein
MNRGKSLVLVYICGSIEQLLVEERDNILNLCKQMLHLETGIVVTCDGILVKKEDTFDQDNLKKFYKIFCRCVGGSGKKLRKKKNWLEANYAEKIKENKYSDPDTIRSNLLKKVKVKGKRWHNYGNIYKDNLYPVLGVRINGRRKINKRSTKRNTVC